MKQRLPLIIALVVGIGITIFSYAMVQKKVDTATQTVAIMVPKTTIEAFSVIKKENLMTVHIPPTITDENTAKAADQLIGKIPTAPLYPGKPIDLRMVAEKPEDVGDKQVVGAYIDAARCAGVTEGDVVDVYRVSSSIQGEPAPLIALNCRVLRITDDKGIPVKGASAIMQNVSTDVGLVRDPRIVYLLVKSQEVPYVIQGSLSKTESYLALAKKGKETAVQEADADDVQ